jgi:hypothetical protein
MCNISGMHAVGMSTSSRAGRAVYVKVAVVDRTPTSLTMDIKKKQCEIDY